jgi:toxin ParE1/3/4
MGAENRYQLTYAPIAYDDLDEIFAYISTELLQPDAAMKLLTTIETAILQLPEFPYQYPISRDAMLAHKGYRMMPVENFAVFYLLDEEKRIVSIRRVLYGKRSFRWLV